MKDKTAITVVGCGFILLRATLIFPLWAYLLYSLLKLTEASDFVWFALWAYIGLQWLSYVAEGIISPLVKSQVD